MQQSENPEVSMSLSINTCYFSSSGYSLGLSPGWKWHWGACSTYFMTWKHKMCGPSPTTSGFLVDPSSLLGKRPLCPWSWLQGLGADLTSCGLQCRMALEFKQAGGTRELSSWCGRVGPPVERLCRRAPPTPGLSAATVLGQG